MRIGPTLGPGRGVRRAQEERGLGGHERGELGRLEAEQRQDVGRQHHRARVDREGRRRRAFHVPRRALLEPRVESQARAEHGHHREFDRVSRNGDVFGRISAYTTFGSGEQAVGRRRVQARELECPMLVTRGGQRTRIGASGPTALACRQPPLLVVVRPSEHARTYDRPAAELDDASAHERSSAQPNLEQGRRRPRQHELERRCSPMPRDEQLVRRGEVHGEPAARIAAAQSSRAVVLRRHEELRVREYAAPIIEHAQHRRVAHCGLRASGGIAGIGELGRSDFASCETFARRSRRPSAVRRRGTDFDVACARVECRVRRLARRQDPDRRQHCKHAGKCRESPETRIAHRARSARLPRELHRQRCGARELRCVRR